MKEYKITEKEGLAYSLESNDKNKIHLDDLTGYNSIFNHKAVYGTLIFLKFIKQLNLKKLNQYSIQIDFIKAFRYNLSIQSNNKKKIQKNGGLAYINFLKEKKYDFKDEKLKLIKTIQLKKINSNKIIRVILNHLSWYVGMVNPGKYSLITRIKFNI